MAISLFIPLKVYIQKVKHLEYEHKNKAKQVVSDGEAALLDELDAHRGRCVQ